MRSTYSAYKNRKRKVLSRCYMAASKQISDFPHPLQCIILSGFRQVATDHAWKHAST